MSLPDEIDPAKAWLVVQKLIDEEDERLALRSEDEELERQLASMPDPPYVPSVAELLERGERRARERAARGEGLKISSVTAPAKRPSWVLWLAAAAVGALVVALFVERREVSAWLERGTPPPIGPEEDQPPTLKERAAKMRDDAYADCEQRLWSSCVRKLDDAKALDPAGDTAPRVQAAREEADDMLQLNPRVPQKR